MSAIAQISAALNYDAVETLIMTDFAAALRFAAFAATSADLTDEETAPASSRTVRAPGAIIERPTYVPTGV